MLCYKKSQNQAPMKKVILLTIILWSFNSIKAQFANNDLYTLRDTILDYTIQPLLNDDTSFNAKIIFASSFDANVTIIGPDSTSLHVTDTSTNPRTISIQYASSNGTISDTAIITILKTQIQPDVYSGDCNNDGAVNYLDLLTLGANIGNYGNPRHNTDTNINFYQKATAAWDSSIININSKFSDGNGDGIVEIIDTSAISSNYGLTHSPYNPSLSPNSNTTFLSSYRNNDTFSINSLTDTIRVPISITGQNQQLTSSGLGYSYNIIYRDTLTQSFKPLDNYKHIKNDPLIRSLTIEKKISDTQDICHFSILQKNDIDSIVGIAEIVIDVIVIGITNPGDITELNLITRDIALVDDRMNFIPISPQTIKVYIKNENASVSIRSNNKKNVIYHYDITNESLIIKGSKLENKLISIYNIIGQSVYNNVMVSSTSINMKNTSSGVYFVKIEGEHETYKFIK